MCKKSSSSRVRKNFITISMVLMTTSIISFSQSAADTAKGLEELPGYTQHIYYSKGHEQRARAVAEIMDEAAIFFKQVINFKPDISLYILSENNWKEIAAPPLKDVYGFPHNLDSHRMAIAATDNDFWKSFTPDISSLSPSMKEKLQKAYGTADNRYSMMPFFDLLAIHESGHSYTSQAGLKMQRHWMGELFVNIMLHTFIAEKRPDLLPALETFPEIVISRGSSEFRFTNLQDFEKLYPTLGMGPKNYGWYQCRLHAAAGRIYNTGGKTVLIKLWNALSRYQNDMTDEDFVTMLKNEVHPSVADVYLKWDSEE